MHDVTSFSFIEAASCQWLSLPTCLNFFASCFISSPSPPPDSQCSTFSFPYCAALNFVSIHRGFYSEPLPVRIWILLSYFDRLVSILFILTHYLIHLFQARHFLSIHRNTLFSLYLNVSHIKLFFLPPSPPPHCLSFPSSQPTSHSRTAQDVISFPSLRPRMQPLLGGVFSLTTSSAVPSLSPSFHHFPFLTHPFPYNANACFYLISPLIFL